MSPSSARHAPRPCRTLSTLLSHLRLRPASTGRRGGRRFRPRLEQLESRVVPAFVINPTFDSTITNDNNAATIEASINTVIKNYENAFSDNITVNITFGENTNPQPGQLGGSSTQFRNISYSDYRNALASHATTADDTTALATLPSGPNRPIDSSSTQTGTLTNGMNTVSGLSETRSLRVGDAVTGTGIPAGTTIASIVDATDITLSNNAMSSGTFTLTFPGNNNVRVGTALLRALGNSAGNVSMDGSISIVTSICNLDRTGPQDPTKYDLMAVAAHEIDEVLGFGSALNGLQNGDQHPATVKADDLFRYDQNGARSYDTNLATQAFFSIDGGATKLARFNQKQGGDFSDWFSTGPHTPQVQDAFNTQGATQNLGVELRRLDVLGYARVTNLAAPTVTAPGTQSAVEGASQSFDLGSFSTFSGDAGPFGVDVDWGDGTAHTKFFVASAGALPSKAHTYAEEGSFTPIVTITDFLGLSGSASLSTVNVSDPAVKASGVAVSAVEGKPFTGVAVATFTDPGGAEPNPSDPNGTHYKVVSIDWGDGTPLDTTSGTISYSGAPGSTTDPFTVSGNHTYGEEGPYTVTIILDHEGKKTTVTTTATVSDPAVLATGVAVSAVEGKAFTGKSVANFTDPGGAEPNPSDPNGTHYKVVSIDWGDGTALDTTSGTISYSGAPGSTTDPFTVSGNHTYGEEGTYTATIIIDHEGVRTTVTTKATVSDPAVLATSVPVFGVECRTLTVTTADFTDPGGAEPNASDPGGGISGHYKVASIDWGDGTALDTTSGTISYSGAPGSMTDPFIVSGSHAFAHEGTYLITTTISHEGIITKTTTTATIKDDLGLLLLDPTGSQSLMVTGNGIVTANGCGAVVVDSNDSRAAFLSGNAIVTAEDIDVTGGVKTAGHGSFSTTVDHEAATSDPLGLALPTTPPSPTHPAFNYSGSAPVTLLPGTYIGGISISGSGPVTLTAGVYYMQGGGFSVTGLGNVSGTGVTIINAPAGPSDTINVSGQARLNLTAPTSGPFQGVALFQDPNSSNPILFAGQASVTLTGVAYVPTALVSIVGNANVTIDAGAGTATLPPILGAMIAYDLKVDGNGVLTINPDDPPSVVSPAVVLAAPSSAGSGGVAFAALGAPVSGGGISGDDSLVQTAILLRVCLRIAHSYRSRWSEPPEH